MLLAVHSEKGLTGEFRFRRGLLQCRVVVLVTHGNHEVDCYKSWRDADEADHMLAEELARHAA